MTYDNIDRPKDWPTLAKIFLQIKILVKIFIVASSIMSDVYYLIMEDDAQHIS